MKPSEAKPATTATTFDLKTIRALAEASTPQAWEQANTPFLVGLERWGRALAESDRNTALGVLVRAAQRGFGPVGVAGADALGDVGFFGKEGDPIYDGASVEVQLARVAAWLAAPSASTKAKVDEGFDRTRQLVVWSEDLLPSDDQSFYWYLDLGQLCCAAVLNKNRAAAAEHDEDEDYYDWSPTTCIARGFVVAVRAHASSGAPAEETAATLFADGP